tara:strand:+ start:2286 stop:3440 length:1155 start_codon:yes stop_codon:yes gene_type:complete
MAWFNFGKETVEAPIPEIGNFSAYDGSVADALNMRIEVDRSRGIYTFGRRNDYPDLLVDLYDNSPTHQAVINRTALMIAGDGQEAEIRSEELVDRVQIEMLINHPNLNESLSQILHKVGRDVKLHGRYAIECVWNEAHDKVVELKHVDAGGVRIGVLNEEGKVPFYKYSEDWNDSNYKITTYFPFDKNGAGSRQLIYVQLMRSGHLYYGLPDYYAAINWIDLESQIGVSHSESAKNGFSPKVAVIFPAKPESIEIEKKTMDNLNKTYSGSRGKKIMGIFSPRPELMPIIQPLNVDMLHKQYQEIDGQTERKILTGHGVVSPMLFGISTSNGFGSNADELRMSYHIYEKTVVAPYQRMVEDSLNRVLSASGNTNRIVINPYTLGL